MTQINQFLQILSEHFRAHGRDLPWRIPVLEPRPDGSLDPYKILVSEVMLQQTQVGRVIPKYTAFLEAFPNLRQLAQVPLSEVLRLWVGLGYNRRAQYLQEAAMALAAVPEPWTFEDLVAQRGIGVNTAAAVLAYSYDTPVLFVETNIRAVIIHHFFKDADGVKDIDVLGVLERLVPWRPGNKSELTPRQFYWAMMDYGSYLKAALGNPNTRSKHYKKQSKFQGSLRQVRGRVIRELSLGPLSVTELAASIQDERLQEVLEVLQAERLIKIQDKTVMLYNE